MIDLVGNIVSCIRSGVSWQHLTDLHDLLDILLHLDHVRDLGDERDSLGEDGEQDLGALRQDGAELWTGDDRGLGW